MKNFPNLIISPSLIVAPQPTNMKCRLVRAFHTEEHGELFLSEEFYDGEINLVLEDENNVSLFRIVDGGVLLNPNREAVGQFMYLRNHNGMVCVSKDDSMIDTGANNLEDAALFLFKVLFPR